MREMKQKIKEVEIEIEMQIIIDGITITDSKINENVMLWKLTEK